MLHCTAAAARPSAAALRSLLSVKHALLSSGAAAAATAPDEAAAGPSVATLYRQLRRRAAGLPEAQRASAVERIGSGFRAPLAVDDDSDGGGEAAALAARVEQAVERLAFLKMVTPTDRREPQTGHTRKVYSPDGQRRERGSARHSQWDGGNMDPDMVARHNRSLKRAGFSGHGAVQGPQGF